jgi:hypothetical protein
LQRVEQISCQSLVAHPNYQRRNKSTTNRSDGMCNAYNHALDCPCGFGGDTGGSGWRHGRIRSLAEMLEPISGGWAKDNGGTVESYVNTNAHCPVCGCSVFFYRSPYNGRVFFDALGWPWPKHGCTDNSIAPRRATRDSVIGQTLKTEPTWRKEGWEPFLSSKLYSSRDPVLVTGDLGDEFLELHLSAGEIIDRESPIFIRKSANTNWFELSFLRSNPLGTDVRNVLAQCIARIPYNKRKAS